MLCSLSPSQIGSVEGGQDRVLFDIIMHAHGDRHLVGKYRPRVVMSELDWRELEQPELQFDNPLWGRPPKRDVADRD